MSDKNNSWFPLAPLAILFVGFVMITSEHRHVHEAYTGFTYPESYKTGVPSKEEITYGTRKTFKESKTGSWAEETWEWSQADKGSGRFSHDSYCGHVLWVEYGADDDSKPYRATAYNNFSDSHEFATLKEADEFVEQWCKP